LEVHIIGNRELRLVTHSITYPLNVNCLEKATKRHFVSSLWHVLTERWTEVQGRLIRRVYSWLERLSL